METVAQGTVSKEYIDEKEFMELMMQNWKEMHTPKVRRFKKVGRNEICPYCDSGLKFKHCECSIDERYQAYESATR